MHVAASLLCPPYSTLHHRSAGRPVLCAQLQTYIYQFKQNMDKVYAINQNPNITYWASGNQFSHLSFAEFRTAYLMNSTFSRGGKTATATSTSSSGRRSLLAADVNWVTAGYVPPVRNQASCGTLPLHISLFIAALGHRAYNNLQPPRVNPSSPHKTTFDSSPTCNFLNYSSHTEFACYFSLSIIAFN